MIPTRIHRRGHRRHSADVRCDLQWLLDHQHLDLPAEKVEIDEPESLEEKLIGWRFVLALLGLLVAYAPFVYFAVAFWRCAPI